MSSQPPSSKYADDEEITRPNSPAHRAANLVRDWARLSKPNQSLVLSLIAALNEAQAAKPSARR